MKIKKIRMPFCFEWANAFTAVAGIEKKIHSEVGSWCQERDLAWPGRRMVGGAMGMMSSEIDNLRCNDIGFRPAFEVGSSEADDIENGTIVTVGTLFMDGWPVRVPTDLTEGRTIQPYIDGQVLSFGKPIGRPGYDVTAIKVGNVLVADRVLLMNVSWTDIVENFGPAEPVVTFRTSRLVRILADAHAEHPTTPYAQGYHDAILDVMEETIKKTI